METETETQLGEQIEINVQEPTTSNESPETNEQANNPFNSNIISAIINIGDILVFAFILLLLLFLLLSIFVLFGFDKLKTDIKKLQAKKKAKKNKGKKQMKNHVFNDI